MPRRAQPPRSPIRKAWRPPPPMPWTRGRAHCARLNRRPRAKTKHEPRSRTRHPHPDDAAIPPHKSGASAAAAVLSYGRFLRTLLRRRAPRRCAARHHPHCARPVGGGGGEKGRGGGERGGGGGERRGRGGGG